MSIVEIVARYQVVTPLFCGGASPPTTAAELRLPSFKGVLRFWWRALAWAHFEGNLTEICAAENDLFGSGGAGSRRSRVVMRLGKLSGSAHRAKDAVLQDARERTVGQGVRYLGYGLMEAFDRRDKAAGQLSRGCLTPAHGAPLLFEVCLRCRGVDPPALMLLRRALEIMGTVGGLGARSRRGFGSLALTELTGKGAPPWRPPTSIAELKGRIADLTAPARHPALPEYTAFSESSRHVLLEASGAGDPLALLDRVGREMVRHRSYGREEKILGGVLAERNFKDDHDLVQSIASKTGRRVASHPRRVAFGLPHNYYFSSVGRSVAVGPGDGQDRRASPLFIHVHMCGASPVAVLSLLPARFLPLDSHGRRTIKVGGQRIPQVDERQLYQPIHEFLDRFGGPHGEERFDVVEEVYP